MISMYVCKYVCTYTRMCVHMYERIYVFSVIITINICYSPHNTQLFFFVMCKDYVLCAAET